MKYLAPTLLSLLAFSFVACSSAHKDTQAAAAPPAAAMPEKTPMKLAPPTNAQTASCTNDGDKRTLEVSNKGSGCELTYTKASKASVVSSSSQGVAYCENSLKKIQAKLEKAGFDCK